MRLFVAVELDESMRNAAMDAARELQARVDERLRPRWVPAENMHLTVRFIGHVADEAGARVLDALRPPLAIPPFELALGECGMFPPLGPPRVLWIGLKQGQPGLRAMHEEFDRRLLPLRFEAEDRPYNAHLTLARIKDAPRGSGPPLRETARTVRPRAASCVISHATVFESHVSAKGARYTPLLRIPLLA